MAYNNESIIYSFKIAEKDSRNDFEQTLVKMLKRKLKSHQRVIVLCIGSDYSVADSLGPLIGHKLVSSHYGSIAVFGTLEFPVDADNLIETINTIDNMYANPLVIAIDSSLGTSKKMIGDITLCEEGITPGDAFGRLLPKVGHISISGTVNLAGISYEKFIRTTRMHLVMTLANFITKGLLNAFDRFDLSYFNEDVN